MAYFDKLTVCTCLNKANFVVKLPKALGMRGKKEALATEALVTVLFYLRD